MFFGGMALCAKLYVDRGGGDTDLYQISVYGSAAGVDSAAHTPNLAIFIATAVLVLCLVVPVLVFRASVVLGTARCGPCATCVHLLAMLACALGSAGSALLVATACVPCCEGAVPAWAPPRNPELHDDFAMACFFLITVSELADAAACGILWCTTGAIGVASCCHQSACVLGAIFAFCAYASKYTGELTVVNSFEWLGVGLTLLYGLPFALTLERCIETAQSRQHEEMSTTPPVGMSSLKKTKPHMLKDWSSSAKR